MKHISIYFWPLLLLLVAIALATDSDPRIHFTLKRRGGRSMRNEIVNLTRIAEIAEGTESRYARTQRAIADNRVSKKWTSPTTGTIQDEVLLEAAGGAAGNWYLELSLGTPAQSIEVDLDMLSPDFYTVMTTSDKGSKLNTFFSSTYEDDQSRTHPLCTYPADVFHLPQPHDPPLSRLLHFTQCSPSRSSRFTLNPSGSILGLAPPSSLSRLPSLRSSMVETLYDAGVLNSKLVSITLLDATTGVLTFGGTLAAEFESSRVRADLALQYLGSADPLVHHKIDSEVDAHMHTFPHDLRELFNFTKTLGAAGHWTPLLSGVWVAGSKVLKTQPALLDISCPFVLAPALATRRFYEAIGGSFRLPAPHDRFWVYPCANRVDVVWEMAGWLFPAFVRATREDVVYGPIGGPMSLGLWENGTGYCVGVVVESRMDDSRSGMRDTWVLGEPFFRGMGVVLDYDAGRIGFRSY